KMFCNGVGAWKDAGIFTERTHTFRNGLRVQAILSTKLLGPENAAENDAVAKSKRLRQRILKHFAAHGVSPRVEHGPETAPRPAAARGVDCGLYRCRMAREVIDHQYPPDSTPHIHSTLDTATRRKSA